MGIAGADVFAVNVTTAFFWTAPDSMNKPNKSTGFWLLSVVSLIGTLGALVAVLRAGRSVGTVLIGVFGVLFFVLLNFATSEAKRGDSDGLRFEPEDDDDWDRPL